MSTLIQRLMTTFYRFLARFSGRRRSFLRARKMQIPGLPLIYLLLVLFNTFLPLVEGCSSRSTPKPRPTPLAPTTSRPNVTFHTYACPDNYDAFYCLNGATCFMVKIGESLLYNCECAEGYMGQRCEFKDLEGSYVPSRHRVMLETASIASGATLAVFLVVLICILIYMHRHRKHNKFADISVVDGGTLDIERRQPFSKREIHQIPLRHIHTMQAKESVSKLARGDHQYSVTLYPSVTTRPP